MKKEIGKGIFRTGLVCVMLAIFLVSCASSPAKLPAAKQAGTTVLNGKSAILLPVTMAVRSKPKTSTLATGGGIFGGILKGAAVNAWVKDMQSVVKKNNPEISAIINEAQSQFIEKYNGKFNASLTAKTFDFGKKEPKITLFVKPDGKTKETITALCGENNAEYAITILYQFIDGDVVDAFTNSNTTYLRAAIVVFDKNGDIVANNTGNTSPVGFRFVYPRGQEPQDYKATLVQQYTGMKNWLVNSVDKL